MIKTTKAQQRALAQKFAQSKLRCRNPSTPNMFGYSISEDYYGSYKQFRRAVCGTYGCDGAITVYWCNMWLCIEKDGYTHT